LTQMPGANMKKEVKSDHLRLSTNNKPPLSKTRSIQNLDAEKFKFLDRMMSALRPMRVTAKSYNFDFLSYLVEMTALEVHREMEQEKMIQQQDSEAITEKKHIPRGASQSKLLSP